MGQKLTSCTTKIQMTACWSWNFALFTSKKFVIDPYIDISKPDSAIYCAFCGNEKGTVGKNLLTGCDICSGELSEMLKLMIDACMGDKEANEKVDQINEELKAKLPIRAVPKERKKADPMKKLIQQVNKSQNSGPEKPKSKSRAGRRKEIIRW